MKLYSKLVIATLAGTLWVSSGCRKYLDVNTNPNVANNATPELLLPAAEVTIANTMGVTMQIYGSIWSQHWTQNPNSSQYRELERYQPTAPDFDRAWTNLYSGAGADLKQLENKARAGNLKQYTAIALLLKSYMFQVITDAWGDVPYTEALRGLPEEGGITAPHYDPQARIYDSLISNVNQALVLIDPADPLAPGGDDLIFGGDMTMWHKFANTLKLRLYMRLSEVNPTKAQAGIATLQGADFLDAGEDAQVSYSSTAGNRNPLYAEMTGLSGTQNLVASKTVIDSMNDNNDIRLLAFFEPASGGAFSGILQGNFNSTAAPGSYSIPSAMTGGNASDPNSALAPVKLLTGYESKFLQAEAVARGWMTGDAAQLFAEGIEANFISYGFTTADAADYMANSYWGQYPLGGSVADQVRHIITQKWFSMTGNEGFEAWTEWRRTGYPDFFNVSVTNLTSGQFPVRFLYPDVEITRNQNFPGTKPVTSRVYWDIK